jgi:glycosyltransferase involved in cell wall biosynthesis
MSTKKNIQVSIIVPSLNQGHFIERTILSILDQKYSGTEIIIIDGGSTDDTIAIIKKYERFLSYWVSEEDRGQSHALNKGLKVCSGDLIGWLNSDDIYLPKVFQELAQVVADNPQCDIYYANRININADDRFMGKVTYARSAPGFMAFFAKYRGLTFCSQAAFFRRNVFNDVGEFDESFDIAMDVDFFYRCILHRKKFHYTNSEWGAWRQHGSAKTIGSFEQDPKRLAERELFLNKHNLYRGPGYGFLYVLAGIWRRLLVATQ